MYDFVTKTIAALNNIRSELHSLTAKYARRSKITMSLKSRAKSTAKRNRIFPKLLQNCIKIVPSVSTVSKMFVHQNCSSTNCIKIVPKPPKCVRSSPKPRRSLRCASTTRNYEDVPKLLARRVHKRALMHSEVMKSPLACGQPPFVPSSQKWTFGSQGVCHACDREHAFVDHTRR